MGALIGTILGAAVERLMTVIGDRVKMARELRRLADELERGDIVPDELLAQAKSTSKTVKDARAKYGSKKPKG